jgi:hemolysin activation/secretion protein
MAVSGDEEAYRIFGLRGAAIRNTLAVSAGLIAAALPVGALAQATPQIPTREEIQRPPLAPAAQPGERILAVDDAIERAPCPLADPQFSHIRFTLRAVDFSSVEGIDPAMLRPSWSDRAGQELPIAAVCDIRDRAATMLRAKGYLAAARVPAQTIDDGVVRLDILAARMTRVEVRGDAGANERLLQRYLSRLDDAPVFNIADAERYLLLARDIPGMDARLTLRPGEVPGEVIGEVTVMRTPLTFDFNVQNLGSRDVGRWGANARARIAGLTGMGDLTTLSFYSTPRFRRAEGRAGRTRDARRRRRAAARRQLYLCLDTSGPRRPADQVGHADRQPLRVLPARADAGAAGDDRRRTRFHRPGHQPVGHSAQQGPAARLQSARRCELGRSRLDCRARRL